MRHFARNGTEQSVSKRFIKHPHPIPRATSIDSECCRLHPRLAFSAEKRTDHAPMSFDEEAQVFLGHTSCRNKGKFNTEVHSGGGLEIW